MKCSDLGDISDGELIEQLFIVIDKILLRIAELEAMVGMNSSVPSSSDPYTKPQSLRRSSDKKHGGQPGHKGKSIYTSFMSISIKCPV
jgi:hypothetical protein